MKVRLSSEAIESLKDAPTSVRRAFEKQLRFVAKNDLKHPSFHAKKYNEANDRWQAHVNTNWRFSLDIVGETYIIRKVIPHPSNDSRHPKVSNR